MHLLLISLPLSCSRGLMLMCFSERPVALEAPRQRAQLILSLLPPRPVWTQHLSSPLTPPLPPMPTFLPVDSSIAAILWAHPFTHTQFDTWKTDICVPLHIAWPPGSLQSAFRQYCFLLYNYSVIKVTDASYWKSTKLTVCLLNAIKTVGVDSNFVWWTHYRINP